MHLTSVLLNGLIGQALAAPNISRRAVMDITDALASVMQATMNLDLAVNSVNSADPTAIANIATMSTVLQNVLLSAQTKVQNTMAVGLGDAITVSNAATMLTANVMTVTADLMIKKPIIDQAGITSVVLQQLVTTKAGADGLALAITNKVPLIAMPVAQMQGQTIDNILSSSIQLFSSPVGAAVPGIPVPAVPSVPAPAVPGVPAPAVPAVPAVPAAPAPAPAATGLFGLPVPAAPAPVPAVPVASPSPASGLDGLFGFPDLL